SDDGHPWPPLSLVDLRHHHSLRRSRFAPIIVTSAEAQTYVLNEWHSVLSPSVRPSRYRKLDGLWILRALGCVQNFHGQQVPLLVKIQDDARLGLVAFGYLAR